MKPETLKFQATPEKGDVSATIIRPENATHLLVLGHGASSNMRTPMMEAIVRTRAECELMVLPAEAATLRSSELLASRTMDVMLQDIRRNFKSQTVIFDMPPLLSGDDVLATLPRIDCVLLVTAVGVSTVHEIKECNRHLQSSEVIRVVLNKAQEPTARYYY